MPYASYFAAHWDGSNWTSVPISISVAVGRELSGVVEISSSDAWAVGPVGLGVDADPGVAPVMLHWDGRAWTSVAEPILSGGNGYLTAIAGIGADDIWAVGGTGGGHNHTTSQDTSQTLIEHWNGSSWSQVASPGADNAGVLYGVAARAADDVWAVGSTQSGGSAYGDTLVYHWDGNRWSQLTSPSPTSPFGNLPGNALLAVAADGPSDVWAVGVSALTSHAQPLIEHWNGSGWRVVAGPSVSSPGALESVAVRSPTNAWAVGSDGSLTTPLAEHWNGCW